MAGITYSEMIPRLASRRMGIMEQSSFSIEISAHSCYVNLNREKKSRAQKVTSLQSVAPNSSVSNVPNNFFFVHLNLETDIKLLHMAFQIYVFPLCFWFFRVTALDSTPHLGLFRVKYYFLVGTDRSTPYRSLLQGLSFV